MKRAFTVAATAFAVTGCGPQDHALAIKGVRYLFPATHEVSIVTEQQSRRGAFARVEPPQDSFHLIYSLRHYRMNERGEDVPAVHWVNDAGDEARVTIVGGRKVVCAAGNSRIHFSCGIRVVDAGLLWAAVFDQDQVPNAPAIHAKAVAYLASYREGALQAER